MSGIIVGILIVCVGVYFYKKMNKKSPCCSKSKQNDSTTVNTDKAEVFEELKNTVESTGEIEIIGEVKSTSEIETIGEVESTSELETISENKREEIEREINIKKLDVTAENLPDIIEMYRPNEVTMETIKNLAKDIYNKQVESLAYSTIYKYIADSYGYRTWKDFKKVLETK